MRNVAIVLIVCAATLSSAHAAVEYACNWATGWDLPSRFGVLNDGHSNITKSARECCQLCNEIEDCVSWTRIIRDADNNKEGECWLRNIKVTGEKCRHCVSGMKETYDSDIPCNSVIQHETEFSNNGLIKGSPFKFNSSRLCCNECSKKKDCKSWTWMKIDTRKGKRRGDCFLRDNVPEGSYCPECISGVKISE